MDFISIEALDRIGTLAVLSVVALGVITDKLVWHTRLKRAQDRADRWERVALEALDAGAQAGVRAAEVTAEVIRSLPDPAKERAEDR